MPFKLIYTPAEVLEAIEYHSDIATADQIADHIGCTIQTANSLLAKLEREGLARCVDHGADNRPVILWRRTAKAIQDVKVIE